MYVELLWVLYNDSLKVQNFHADICTLFQLIEHTKINYITLKLKV